MPTSPETRPSLMLRLLNAGDEAAWAEFLAIYEPILLRLLRKHGLQDSDARDVCQQVLAAVACDLEQWKPDGAAASFRRWLFQIARHRVIKFLSRQRPWAVATGGTDAHELMAEHPDSQESLTAEFEVEYRQQLLLCAAAQIRGEFRESTWLAFWKTCIDGRGIADVADELGMTAGNVYVARSRIMARLRTRVAELQEEE